MLWTALAATLAAASADVPRLSAAPAVQARATVRIVSGVRLRLGEAAPDADAPAVRQTMVRIEGRERPARLIEFE